VIELEKLQIKASDAICFLEEHPAIGPMFDVFQALRFSINPVCKRSYLECAKSGVTIRLSSKHAKRFKKEFEKELKEYTEEELKTCKPLVSIKVPYKDLFGEEWKFDHIEYWADMVFYKFEGKKEEYMDQKKWTAIEAIRCIPASRTFEEMIVKVARQFKKIYGDFDCDDFLTKREKQNHKKEMAMLLVDKATTPAGNKISHMISNPKYIKVTYGEINQRWFKWFKTTDYYKKNF